MTERWRMGFPSPREAGRDGKTPLISDPSFPSDAQFRKVADLAREIVGIKLDHTKRALVATRVGRRMRALGLQRFEDYAAVLEKLKGLSGERQAFANAITTHKTDFFREAHHFEFLREALPELMARASAAGRPLGVWSAGCSSGEEAYTIGMTALEAGIGPPRCRILATDIDDDVLTQGREGIYREDRMGGLTTEMRSRYMLRGKGQSSGHWRVKPILSQLVEFRQFNLMQRTWQLPFPIDVIFCRNVLIYFDGATIRTLLSRFAEQLPTGGLLMVGHSETLHGLSERFDPVGNTVYVCQQGRHSGGATKLAPEKRIVAGEVFVSKSPTWVSTILGSCVAACLWDETSQVGGMNHFMLPHAKQETGPLAARYGVFAMEQLINKLLHAGAEKSRLKAKVFGASQLGVVNSAVQHLNATFIRAFLQKEGIPIIAERLLGRLPLDVKFRTDTGRALLRSISTNVSQARQVEAQAMQSFRTQVESSQAGSVELF